MSLRKWILSSAMLAAAAMPAFADEQTEEYVRVNANDVLASLNAPGLTAVERREQFQTYMDEFTNLDAVAKFVIGKYARRFTPEEMDLYLATFRNYALVVYEFYFNEYRGRDVKVVGSTDRNARDSIVDTEIVRSDGQELEVRWRVLLRGGEYQVVDVALNAEGNLIWLAIEQQAQFLSILDQNNGSVDALIAKIDSMTDELVALRPAEDVAVEAEPTEDAAVETVEVAASAEDDSPAEAAEVEASAEADSPVEDAEIVETAADDGAESGEEASDESEDS